MNMATVTRQVGAAAAVFFVGTLAAVPLKFVRVLAFERDVYLVEGQVRILERLAGLLGEFRAIFQ